MFDKLYTQRIFADQVGARLEKFRVQSYSPYRANFRCPICGDSQKNKHKKRGFFIQKDNRLLFYCHNECGTIGFERFLKEYYGDIYTTYKFDLFKSMRDNKSYIPEDVIEEPEEETIILEREIELDLATEHSIANNYIRSRKIPERFYDDIYFTDRFHAYINEIIPHKFPDVVADVNEPRIVLPLRGYDNKIFGVISRSLSENAQSRYLTIKYDEDSPKIFGLDRINRNELAYICEGPIDSFFIDNCCAIAGTDGNPDTVFSNKTEYAMILDNQPRSPSVLKKYEMYINRGCQIVIWPRKIIYKDINDCIVKGGMTIPEINSLIRSHTYRDLKAKIMFNEWRRLNGSSTSTRAFKTK